MAKFALIFLALIAVALAKPYGGMMAGGHQSHVSSSHHVMSPYGMFGYGMGMGFPGGMVGHSISSHSIGHQHHVMPHYGYGMMGIYPGMGGLGLMG